MFLALLLLLNIPQIKTDWIQRTSSGSRRWYSVSSSSDGTKLIAGDPDGYLYTSSDSGVTWIERTSSGTGSWSSSSSSSDGVKIFAGDSPGYIYTSSDSGVTWIAQTSSGSRRWYSVSSSSDGTKLIAANNGGYLYTSSDSGVTWIQRTSSGSRSWYSVSSSSDGTKLIAGVNGGYLYTSSDSGVKWIERTSSGSRNWRCVSSSSDGVKLIAANYGGYLYTSSDSGVTWIERTSSGSRNWRCVSSSSDGTKLIAGVDGGYLYISSDSGVTWIAQTSAGSRIWYSVSSSSDGTKLIAANYGGYMYTSSGFVYTVEPTAAPSNSPTISFTPTMKPTFSPTFTTTFSPSLAPTISFSPTSTPTSNPTTFCLPGSKQHDFDCVKCEIGFYSTEYNSDRCIACPEGKTNVEKGSTDCKSYIAGVSIDLPITLCAAYSFFTISFYLFIIAKGGPRTLLFTILLVAGDQVTDILNAFLSAFQSYLLLLASISFCFIPYLPYLWFLYEKTTFEMLFCVRLFQFIDGFFSKFGVIGGLHFSLANEDISVINAPEGRSRIVIGYDRLAYSLMTFRSKNSIDISHFDFKGWVFHDFVRLNTDLLFFKPILIIGDIIWPFVRIVLTFIIVLLGIPVQILLIIIAMIAYSNKLFAVYSFHTTFWSFWTGKDLQQIEGVVEQKIIVSSEVNTSILVEIFFESIPQVVIQLSNNLLLYKGQSWPLLPSISFAFSVMLVLAPIHHYWKYFFILKVPLKEIPEFDMISECLAPRGIHRGIGTESQNNDKKIGTIEYGIISPNKDQL